MKRIMLILSFLFCSQVVFAEDEVAFTDEGELIVAYVSDGGICNHIACKLGYAVQRNDMADIGKFLG